MKNVRIEGDDLVYDCDGVGCTAPGQPHRVPMREFLASLEATYKEFLCNYDPRTESLDLALQYMYEQLYQKQNAAPLGKDAPWHSEYKRLATLLQTHYDDIDSEKPDKELLN